MEIQVGQTFTQEITVRHEDTAAVYGSGKLEVFATPALVALMENTAIRCLENKLDAESDTVGRRKPVWKIFLQKKISINQTFFVHFPHFFRTNDDSGTPPSGVPLSSLQAVRTAISTRNRRARPRLPARRTPRRAPSGRAVRSRLSASARSGTPSGNGCRAARGPATR